MTWIAVLALALLGTRLLTRAGVHRAPAPPLEGVRFSRPWPPAR